MENYSKIYKALRNNSLCLRDRRLEILFCLFSHRPKSLDRVSISKLTEMSYQSALYELEKMVEDRIVVIKKSDDFIISNTAFYTLTDKTIQQLQDLFSNE